MQFLTHFAKLQTRCVALDNIEKITKLTTVIHALVVLRYHTSGMEVDVVIVKFDSGHDADDVRPGESTHRSQNCRSWSRKTAIQELPKTSMLFPIVLFVCCFFYSIYLDLSPLLLARKHCVYFHFLYSMLSICQVPWIRHDICRLISGQHWIRGAFLHGHTKVKFYIELENGWRS